MLERQTFRISKKVRDERKRIFRDRDTTSRLNFLNEVKKSSSSLLNFTKEHTSILISPEKTKFSTLVQICLEEMKNLKHCSKFSQRSQGKFKFSLEFYQRTRYNSNFSREN